MEYGLKDGSSCCFFLVLRWLVGRLAGWLVQGGRTTLQEPASRGWRDCGLVLSTWKIIIVQGRDNNQLATEKMVTKDSEGVKPKRWIWTMVDDDALRVMLALRPHGEPQKAAQHAPHPLGVFQGAGEDDGSAGGEDERFAALLGFGIPPGQQGGEGPRRDKEGHVLAAGGRLDEDAPTTESAASGDAEAAVEALTARDVLADQTRAEAGAAETDAVIEEGDEGGEKSG